MCFVLLELACVSLPATIQANPAFRQPTQRVQLYACIFLYRWSPLLVFFLCQNEVIATLYSAALLTCCVYMFLFLMLLTLIQSLRAFAHICEKTADHYRSQTFFELAEI